MKARRIYARHIFLLILVAFSVVFYSLLFTQNALLFRSVKKSVIFQAFAVYHIASWAILTLGLESEKKAGGGLGELTFFLVAFAIAVVTKCYFSSDAGVIFYLDKEPPLIFAFSTPIVMIFYEIVYLISKKAFNHDFEFVGKFDLFKRPADWLLSMLIVFGGIGSGYFLMGILS